MVEKYKHLERKEVFKNFRVGTEVTGRVTAVKEDGKLDLSIREKIPAQMDKDAEYELGIMKKCDGKLPFNDKADAEKIKKELGMSKNAFKRAVGRLLKERKIEIKEDSIVMK